MTCPNCNAEYLRPYHTDGMVRQYHCPFCHYRFETTELVRASAQRQAFQAAMFEIVKAETRATKIPETRALAVPSVIGA